MDWLKNRLKEPSTFLGLGLLAQAIGALFKLDNVQPVVDTVNAAGASITHGDYTTAIAVGLTGLLGVFVKEKAK